MPSTITAYTSFTLLTNIKSSEVNANFSNHRGTLIPIHETTATAGTTGTYNLGTSEYTWLGGYVNNLFLQEYATSTSAPTPASGFRSVYVKTDNEIYTKDDAGTESLISRGAPGTTIAQTTVVASYSITSSDFYIFCHASTAAFPVYLPTLSANINRRFVIQKQTSDTTFNAITVTPISGELIDGLTNTTLNTFGEKVEIVGQTSAWAIVSRDIPSQWATLSATINWSSTSTTLYKRVGDSMFVQLYISVNTAPSNALILTWPTGINLDTNKTPINNSRLNLGHAYYSDAGTSANNCSGHATYNATTSVFFIRDGGTTVNQTSPFTWALGDWLNWASSPIPVQGWKE